MILSTWRSNEQYWERATSTTLFVLKPICLAGLYTSATDRLITRALELTATASTTNLNFVATGMTAFGIAIENWRGWRR
ncbi:MAG: hypothetical protein IPJ26_16915 [Bacteroidetes bacterium]|nr:hypothetical protein [Bacteroidota bacterium]